MDGTAGRRGPSVRRRGSESTRNEARIFLYSGNVHVEGQRTTYPRFACPSGPAGFWNFGSSLAQPIFAGGRIKSGVRLAEARQKELLLSYQQTIQQAFRGVSDALVGYRKSREFRQHQYELVVAVQDAARLSGVRYRGGAASYLEVLTNETNAFSAELGLADAQLIELLILIENYRNLGGGWES